jgi:crossover junction endodeoxyribonuclease RuvC
MTSRLYIAGIDPGLSGAVALYQPGANTAPTILDMPTYEITTNGKKRRQLNIYELARWLDLNAPTIKEAVIEDPRSMPTDGGVQAFKFGFNCGAVQGVVAANFIPTKLVAPNAWKRAMGLTSDKDASRRLASQMLPQHAGLWARVKDDGRAEALLLAIWGAKQ